jgi:molybdopterin synthase sulfur carrier subunit
LPVGAVRDRLIAEYPKLSQLRDITGFGIKFQFVEPENSLRLVKETRFQAQF